VSGTGHGDLSGPVREAGLLVPGRPVVVLLSGGRDSVCLLDVAVSVAGQGAVGPLHVNYGLRDAADADERHCAELCHQLGVTLEVARPRCPETGNLQAWARDERYGAAAELARRRGAEVAAGHTATDQVETILYRLASSPSRRALLGMRAREGSLIRPLLGFTREQTARHCAARGLGWREDESNDGRAYARGRVRHGLVPALREVHPGAEANVLALAEVLRGEAEVLDELIDRVLEGASTIGLARLRSLHPALRRLLIQRLADEAAGGLAAGVARRADEVAALPDHGTSALDLPSGVRAIAQAGVLRFERTPHAARAGPPGPKASTGGRSRPPGTTPEKQSGRSPPIRSSDMDDDLIGEILVPADDLARRVRELAADISRDYAGRDLVLIGVLKGAVFFLSDLMRHLEVPCEVDFMAVASYGSATKSSGVVRILKDLDAVIEGRDVLIVEDIVDSGLTLQYLLRNLGARNPRSLEVCALLTKPERRKVDLPTRYVGFEIPNRFAIGYGLDHLEQYRNLPYVAALNE
jgi:hypoxanthine phosphoribosyltransferase